MDGKDYYYNQSEQEQYIQMTEPAQDQEPIVIEINSPDNYWFESGTAIIVALISAFVALRLKGHK